MSLSSLRGHTVALTFLDPVCTSDCPLIAQEFHQTDERLGSQSSKVDFVAIVANPIYRSISFTNAFDRQEGLTHVGNWLYLTGSVSQLRQVWNSDGVLVETSGAGAMIAHNDLAFVIDARGHEAGGDGRRPGRRESDVVLVLLSPRSHQRRSERVSGRRGRFRVVVTTVAVAGQIVSACVMATALVPRIAGAAAPGPPAPPTLGAPLAVALTTASGSWAVVAMGQSGVALNTFWQVFFRAAGATSWTLVTPTGVADNGGLTLTTAADGSITVGFEPSQRLNFSPLARSDNEGSSWTPPWYPPPWWLHPMRWPWRAGPAPRWP